MDIENRISRDHALRTDQVRLRPLRINDHAALIELLRRAWYDRYEPNVGRLMAEADWESCLARATQALVAVTRDDTAAGQSTRGTERPLGVILGRVDVLDSRPLLNRHRRHRLRLLARLPFVRHGFKGLAELLGIELIDALLLRGAKRAGHHYAAEVVLFIVDPESQGLGLGGRLFDALMAYLRDHGAERYFLFTDTSCNYGFYEHRGLKRVSELALQTFPAQNAEADAHSGTESGNDEPMRFFLYEGTMPPRASAPAVA